MTRMRACFGLAGVLALAGCAVPGPAGPGVAAMPGQGKSYEQFQIDDAVCRQVGTQATGGMTPSQAATNSAIGSAAIGTALGAVAGALIGSTGAAMGAGAAIGAGTGLLMGSAVGAGNAQYSAAVVQQQYDIAYAQCMTGKGNQVQQYAAVPRPYYGYGYPAYPPAYYYSPRYYYAPY